MNVLTIFEQRISAIFEEDAPGQRKPFSFKRLAKRAVREMEDETFVIDGVDTAPALYTVLVSSKDDELMRPMYARICEEVSQLVEAQAKKRGYTFVGRPLVRFMVDPAMRAGRFSVFAENVDPRTLARLRDEENAYLGLVQPQDLPFSQGFVPEQVPVVEMEPAPVASEVAFVEEDLELGEGPVGIEPATDADDGPDEYVDDFDDLDAPEESEIDAMPEQEGLFAEEDAEEDEDAADVEQAADDAYTDEWIDEEETEGYEGFAEGSVEDAGIEAPESTPEEDPAIEAPESTPEEDPAIEARPSTRRGAHFRFAPGFFYEDDADDEPDAEDALDAEDAADVEDAPDAEEAAGAEDEPDAAEDEPAQAADPAPMDVAAESDEQAIEEGSPEPEPARAAAPAPAPTPMPMPDLAQVSSVRRQRDTCTLTDVATGRVYHVITHRTPIGRERMEGGIVLRDPNVSRRHAELLFVEGVWLIRDLNSTNGTLVDDMDVREAVLANGDVITIGLTNLEFKAG